MQRGFIPRAASQVPVSPSRWFPRPRQQVREVVQDTGRAKVRLPLEGLPEVVDLVPAFLQEFDDRQDVVIRFVERKQDFVAGNRDGRRPLDPAFHFDEPEFASLGNPALDVVSQLLELSIDRLETHPTLHIHDNVACLAAIAWVSVITASFFSLRPAILSTARNQPDSGPNFGLERDPDKVAAEIRRRVQADAAKRGDFHGVHCFPREAADVPDDPGVRLAILGVDHAYLRGGDSPAEAAARALLDSRGTGPRLCRNAVVFLAPDRTRLQDLEGAVRMYLAWQSIVAEKETLNLTPFQVKQAQTRLKEEEGRVKGQIPEVFQWLLVPVQAKPADKVTWEALRLTGAGELAERASARLKREELLVTRYASTRLRMDLDRIPLWQDNVEVRQLAEHYSRYTYLQRVEDPTVIVEAVREGVGLLTWEAETFAYAEGYDEEKERYLGLQWGAMPPPITADDPGLVVRPEVAREQMDAEVGPEPGTGTGTGTGTETGTDTGTGTGTETGTGTGPEPLPETGPKRFHGSVEIDPVRAGKAVGLIAQEVVSHLEGLVGSNVNLTLEIAAEIPDGAPEHVVRTVTENARTLGFKNQGFEDE